MEQLQIIFFCVVIFVQFITVGTIIFFAGRFVQKQKDMNITFNHRITELKENTESSKGLFTHKIDTLERCIVDKIGKIRERLVILETLINKKK